MTLARWNTFTDCYLDWAALDFSRDFDSLQLDQHGGPGKASSNKGRRLSTIGRNAAYLWAVFSKGNNTEPRS
ncbi:unnamed protein product [Fusarium graminearum]|nr:unnamed protein product [Fusarium graminearum]CAG2001048.1 unnamed protein product [Fusarium graminearum]VTO93404.1 unnamed protein product [Fusarium graminearum]